MIGREKGEQVKTLEHFFNALDSLSENDLISFINWVLNRKFDKKIAIKELHEKMSKFNSLANNFYIFFNNTYYYPSLVDNKENEEDYFTMEEIAKKFNISEKTISNWEKSGLRILRPSPRILIISKHDLFTFLEKKSD